MKRSKKLTLISAAAAATLLSSAAVVTACSTSTPAPEEPSVQIFGNNPIYVYTEKETELDYTATVSPATISPDVIWTAENVPEDLIKEDRFKFENGHLTLNLPYSYKDFKFKITATSVEEPTASKTLDISVGVLASPVESINIQAPTGVVATAGGGSYDQEFNKGGSLAFTATASPSDSNQEMEWEADPNCEDFRTEGIHFDNGVLSWDTGTLPKMSEGEPIPYYLTFIATAKSTIGEGKIPISESYTLQLKIGKVTPTAVQIDKGPTYLTSYVNQAKKYNYEASVLPYVDNPEIMDDTVSWKIKETTNLVEFTNQETGELTLKSMSNPVAETDLTIIASSNEDNTVFTEFPIKVSVTDWPPTAVKTKNIASEYSVKSGDNIVTTPEFEASVETEAGGVVSQDVIWETSELPEGIELKTTGNKAFFEFNGNNKNIKPNLDGYKVSIWAKSKVDQSVMSDHQEVTIKVNYHDIDSIDVTASQTALTLLKNQEAKVTYSAKVQPEQYCMQDVKWTAKCTPEEGAHVTIDEDTGNLTCSFDSNGSYGIVVTATSKQDKTETKTSTLSVKVTDEYPQSITVTGPQTITLGYGQQPTEEIKYNASIYPEAAGQDVTWSLSSDKPNGLDIDPSTGVLKINDGSNIKIGSYPLTVTATAVQHETTKDPINKEYAINVTITGLAPDTVTVAQPEDVTIKAGETYSQLLTATCKKGGSETGVIQDVTWSISPETTGIEIGEHTGLLTIDSTAQIQSSTEYTVTATSTATTNVAGTATFNITINQPDPTSITINGNPTIGNKFGEGGSQQYTAQVNPTKAAQTVTWQANGLDNTKGITLNSTDGTISWTNTTPVGTYNIDLWATSTVNTVSSEVYSITLTIINPDVTSVTIDAGHETVDITKGVAGQVQYTATVLPAECQQKVTWSHSGTLPNGVSFDDTTGILSWTADAEFGSSSNFKITATSAQSTGTAVSSTPMAVAVNVPEADPTSITITGPTLTNVTTDQTGTGEITFNAVVNPINAQQKVFWGSSEPYPEGISVDTTKTTNTSMTLKLDYDALAAQGVGTTDKITLEVSATSSEGVTVTQNYETVVKVISPVPTGISITDDTGAVITSDVTIDATAGHDATQKFGIQFTGTTTQASAPIQWVVDDSTPLPEGASLIPDETNHTMILHTGSQLTPEHIPYNIKLTAIADTPNGVLTSQVVNININVTDQDSILISGPLVVPADPDKEYTADFTAILNNSGVATNDVYWEIAQFYDPVPDGVYIDQDGTVHSRNVTVSGQVMVFINAYSKTTGGLIGNSYFSVASTTSQINYIKVGTDYIDVKCDLNLGKDVKMNEPATDADSWTITLPVYAEDRSLVEKTYKTSEIKEARFTYLAWDKGQEKAIPDNFLRGNEANPLAATQLDFNGFGGITSIGDYFLDACINLDYINAINTFNTVKKIGGHFMSGARKLTSTILDQFKGAEEIGEYFMAGSLRTEGCATSLDFNSLINIQDGKIGKGFLWDCYNLTEVDLGSKINVSSFADATDKEAFATMDSSAACYTTGITIKGKNSAAIVQNFGEETGPDQYRKLTLPTSVESQSSNNRQTVTTTNVTNNGKGVKYEEE